jgi:hypothetical protein
MVAICSPWMCRWWMCSRRAGGSRDRRDFVVCAKELVSIRNDRGPDSAGQDHSRLGLVSFASGVAGSSLRASARHKWATTIISAKELGKIYKSKLI